MQPVSKERMIMKQDYSKQRDIVDKICQDVVLPKMVKVRQVFDKSHLEPEEIPDIVFQHLSQAEIAGQIHENDRIAIAVGSRGITNMALIAKSVVEFVKSKKAIPFIFPSMGSHGGATAEGQRALLAGYGVTEEYCGCPILSTMETVQIGELESGMPVFMDKNAHDADGIILTGRIKAHTAFRAPHESGLMKMSVIGMGKQQGAETVHESGFENMGELMPKVAKVVLGYANVICGLGIIENAYDQTYKLEALTKEEIWTKEPELLVEAKSKMGRILFDEIDELVVDEIGKDISGDGMDPNVTGRFACYKSASGGIEVKRIVVLDLTEKTHGNFNGLGVADITTKRCFDKMDADETYPNGVTSTVLDVVKVPIVTRRDETAIKLGLKTCNGTDKSNPYIVRIRNTKDLEEIYISEAMLEEAKKNPDIQILGEPEEWAFDEQGNLF